MNGTLDSSDGARRARTRRLTLALAALAAAIYVGYIVLSILRAGR